MEVYERGVRQLAANVPINKPKDAAGLKLRVSQIPSWVKMFQQIGFLPTPVALPEAFVEAARPALEELFVTEWSVTS